MRFATGEDIDGLNTHLYNGNTTVEYLSALTAAWLTRTGLHNEPVPELATIVPAKANGGISSDGKRITWHLRKGVVWSDGAPFTADDVVFSTRAVLNPANNETTRLRWNLITRIDEPEQVYGCLSLKTAVWRVRLSVLLERRRSIGAPQAPAGRPCEYHHCAV